MTRASRRRVIAATDPAGEAICSLTAAEAHARVAPIDRVLEVGTFTGAERGYEIRLPGGDEAWALAERFVNEESTCCPSFHFEAVDEGPAVTIRASYGTARSAGAGPVAPERNVDAERQVWPAQPPSRRQYIHDS